MEWSLTKQSLPKQRTDECITREISNGASDVIHYGDILVSIERRGSIIIRSYNTSDIYELDTKLNELLLSAILKLDSENDQRKLFKHLIQKV